MGWRSDAALALLLALGLHGAALALIAQRPGTGATAAGDGGADLVTIAPVAGDVAALIAAWEAPPVVATTAPEVTDPLPVPDTPPDLAAVTAPPVEPIAPLAEAPPVLSPVPAMTPPPAVDAPPPELSPVPQVSADLRPKPRPKPDPEPSPKAEAKPKPKAAPVPAAQAAGTGGGAAVGQAGQAQAGTADSAGMQDAITAWGADIRARIERKKTYPRAADGATGVVTLVITVSPQGALGAVSVAASSGNPVLDAAAVQAVQSARLPKGPAGMDPAGHSFRFRLRYER